MYTEMHIALDIVKLFQGNPDVANQNGWEADKMNIFMDLEMQKMNDAPEEIRKIWCVETIEIGAVAVNDDGIEFDRFKTFVRPQYSRRITKKISDLTGISTGQILGAEGFERAFHEFMAWCSKFNNPAVYSWSEGDLMQLAKECILKKVTISENEQGIMDNWRDLQKEFDELVNAKQPIGLERAVNMCGFPNDGRKHDAYWDARNTARIFISTRNKDAFLQSLENIKEMLDYEEEPLTLGSMIDFSAFSLSA